MQAPWWWSKTETCRNDIYVYFNINFNVFFKLIKVHLFVSELYMHPLFLAQQPPQWARASSLTRFLDHTQRRNTVSMTLLDEWSASRRDLYLKIHNTQTDIHASGGIQTHSLSRRAAADPRLRPRGHWDWQCFLYNMLFISLPCNSYSTLPQVLLTQTEGNPSWIQWHIFIHGL